MRTVACCALLALIGCNPGGTPAVHTLPPPVHRPSDIPVSQPAPKVLPPMHGPREVTKEDLAQAQQWITFLSKHLGKGLDVAFKICSAVDPSVSLELMGSDEAGRHWFTCGGADGYTLAVDDDGIVQYVADSNHPAFRLEVLIKLFGAPENTEKSEELTEHWWGVQAINDKSAPVLIVTFTIPTDKSNRPFVSVERAKQKSEQPSTPKVESGGTLNL